jgi:uncharacterized membrane protein YdjX (TVP38/TMEM64 family)
MAHRVYTPAKRLTPTMPACIVNPMTETVRPPSRIVFVALIVVVALLVSGAVWFSLDNGLKELVQRGLELIRRAGPTTFFLAMALLPALGAPLSFFCLTAGSVFGPQLGMPAVMALSLTAIATNIALSYLLATRALRPPLEALIKRLGYQMPRVASGDTTDLIVLLRVTPGLPFPVQNYLLGLAAVPFTRYLLVSCLIAFPLNAAIIIFGEALLQGKGRTALLGLLLLLALMAVIHLVRRRYRTINDPAR